MDNKPKVIASDDDFLRRMRGEPPAPIVLKIYNGRDLALTTPPAREWYVPGVIPAARVNGSADLVPWHEPELAPASSKVRLRFEIGLSR